MAKSRGAWRSSSARLLLPVLLGIAIATVLSPPRAQAATPLPTNAPVPQGSPLPRVLPQAPLVVAPATPAAPRAISPAVPNENVPVRQIVIAGVTAYSAARIATLTQGLVGSAVPLRKIEATREAILGLYQDDGYVLTAVSANLGVHGTLRFLVTEGRIVAVKLSGNIGPAGTQVLRFLHRLTEIRPVTSAALERALLLAQSVPGVSLHAVLQPSTDQPGALTLIAEVSRRVVSGLFTTDNYGSTYTGPEESLLVFN
ncbi:MAG: POTRA domain-containing protein, partial [Acetobacteraceae bacterium]